MDERAGLPPPLPKTVKDYKRLSEIANFGWMCAHMDENGCEVVTKLQMK